jgi:hypothetical protein
MPVLQSIEYPNRIKNGIAFGNRRLSGDLRDGGVDEGRVFCYSGA